MVQKSVSVPKKPETKFKEKVLRDLKTLEHAWFYKTQEVARHGILDITLCLRGYFIAIELKKDTKSKPTELQIHTGRKIWETGGVAIYVSPEEWPRVWDFLQRVDRGELNPPWREHD